MSPAAARSSGDRSVPARSRSCDFAVFLATQSPKYREAVAFVDRLARHDRAVVLLEGEPGTGKTVLARRLHAGSRRADGAFHRVDLGTLDDSLSGSDLFGHVTGAFTGAQARRVGHFVGAQGGTLFLDELAKASKCVQQKLLHAIEYREVTPIGAERAIPVDVRIVAATNVSLEERVDAGDFLPDLLPRFGHFRVRIPPLRERSEDIVPLATHFVVAHAPAFGYRDEPPALSPALRDALTHAHWPGNVRELDNAVQYLLVVAGGDPVLGLEHCTGSIAGLRQVAREQQPPLTADVVRRAVSDAGSVSAAARHLNTSRPTIYRYLRREDENGSLAVAT